MLEHGAYTLLLDRYYTTERGIPEDQAHRVCRARTRDEKEAVDTVLREFFNLADGVWVNGRAEREITKMQAKVKAAQENGRRGGRPRQTQQEPTGLSAGSDSVTQQKAHQSPDTSNQSPIKTGESDSPQRGSRLPKDWVLPDEWAQWASAERPDLNPNDVACRFADHWHAVPGAKGRKLDWQMTWRNWVRSERAAPGAQSQSFRERDARIARERWEEMTGEQHPDNAPRSNILDFVDLTPRIGAPA